MKNLKSISLLLIATMALISCKKEEASEGSLMGVWIRTLGPSGDKSEIAIGNIPGEAENRVYMCETVGNVGLYKGYLNENTITWDSNHGLPNSSVKRVGSQLEFYYPSISYSVPTLYDSGQWSSKCGSLENSSIRIAVGITPNEDPKTGIRSVSIDGKAVPLTILNSVTTSPSCESTNSFLTLAEPAKSNEFGGYYTVKVTYNEIGLDGRIQTHTSTSTFYKYYFKTNACNIFEVVWGPHGYTLFEIK